MRMKWEIEWRRNDGALCTVTFSYGANLAEALVGARKQVFAKRFNPYHLVYRVIRSTEAEVKKQNLTRAKTKRSISTEVDAQGDFWWNKGD